MSKAVNDRAEARTIYVRETHMAPLPANNTARYFLDYSVAGFSHTLINRVDPEVTDADAASVMDSFMDIVGAFCYPITVEGFRFQQAGLAVSYDVPWTGSAGWGTGAAIPANTAQYYDFVGRDTSGRRVRVATFGAGLVTSGGDYRISPAEATWVADALDALTQDGQMFLTIGGEVPVWKQYANCGVNAYWRNKVR